MNVTEAHQNEVSRLQEALATKAVRFEGEFIKAVRQDFVCVTGLGVPRFINSDEVLLEAAGVKRHPFLGNEGGSR